MESIPFKPRAAWIWAEKSLPKSISPLVRSPVDLSEDTNRYIMFRLAFTLEDASVWDSPLIVSADGRYELYLDGSLIGRGPGRSRDLAHQADTYDLSTQKLEPGRHVIAALVHSYGRSTSWYQLPGEDQLTLFGCGAFLLQGSAGGILFDTCSKWKYLESSSRLRDVPFGGTGFVEYYNSSQEIPAWNETDYDHRHWMPAMELKIFREGIPAVTPFPRMMLRATLPLHETTVKPQKVFTHGDGITAVFSSLVVGRVCITYQTDNPVTLRLRFAERITPQNRAFIPPEVPGISSPPEHRITLSKEGSFSFFEPAGFRCVEILAQDLSDASAITSITAEKISYPTELGLGHFQCSDKQLVKIWEAGVRTVSNCIMDSYVDCPTREQRCWSGDIYVSSLIGYRCLGVVGPAEKFLFDVAMTQRSDGMMLMAAACDLSNHEFAYIPDFSLLYVLAWEQYLLHSGDYQTAQQLSPQILHLLNWYGQYRNQQGLLEDVPGWVLFEWAEPLVRNGCTCALNALYVAALRAAQRYIPNAHLPDWQTINESLHEAMWDWELRLYRDAPHSRVISQQANSLMVYFELAPREVWNDVVQGITDESRVTMTKTWAWDQADRPFDPERHIVMAQPFYTHFLHGALYRVGRGDLLYRSLNRWTNMLESGDTFWESWELTPISSTCHGFSATPAYDISRYILGIHIDAPGYSVVTIDPLAPDCLDSAEGSIPTRLGRLDVAWEKASKGTLSLTVSIPSGIQALIQGKTYKEGIHKISYERFGR